MRRPFGVVTTLMLSGICSANAQEQATKTPLTVPTITKSLTEADQAKAQATETAARRAKDATRRTNVN